MTRLWLEIPGDFEPEVRWILEWVIGEVFGFECTETRIADRAAICGDDGRELRLPLTFFERTKSTWLEKGSTAGPPGWIPLDALPEARQAIGYRSIPDFFPPAEDAGLFEMRDDIGVLHLDVVGGLFYFMSRYEEVVVETRDNHDRFPASASSLGKAGLLSRAVGNEYLQVLWAAMKRLWPRLERKRREFRLMPSHDIDFPSAYWNASLRRQTKLCATAVLSGDLSRAARTPWEAFGYPKHGWAHDPEDTIDCLMDLSEEAGAKSTFFYIPEQTDERLDPGMPLDHPHIEDQWRRIAARGHEIGVHPGYQTYRNPELIRSGVSRVRQQLDQLRIRQEQLGSRQHYLRSTTPATATALDQAGVDYDSTLGFADHIGFRCGVCYEFPMYDLVNRRPLAVRQRPLLLMDCSLMDARYMGLGASEKALRVALELKDECRKYQGDFTILWHNDRLCGAREEELYRGILCG